MKYIVRRASIGPDGTVSTVPKDHCLRWDRPLQIGGLYFFNGRGLYMVVAAAGKTEISKRLQEKETRA